MTRRELLGTGASVLLAPKAAVQRPNILLILADDLAAWMTGCYGNREIKTPNIDQLARTGARFANSFVCTPICSPSRATLFTGRVPQQHGMEDFLTDQPIADPPQGQLAPPASFASETMLSDLLAQAGYRCGYVGKWHMGGDQKPGHGYQYTYTMLGGSTDYQNPRMSLNGELRQERGWLTELMTQRANEFLDQQTPDKPFFLTASYFNPHTPYAGQPQKYYDLYKDTTFDSVGYAPAAPNALREKELLQDTLGNLRKCAASVTALDDQIPLLLRKLQEKGLRDNTLIVFAGDNGYLLGRHGLWSKGEASNPINMYEEVMAVPLLMSWPGRIPAESVRPEMVSFYDVMPTLCAAAGVAAPANRRLVGRSFLDVAMGRPLPKKQPWPTHVFGHLRNTEMARDRRYKLVSRNGGQGPNELFDLSSDPREKVNRIDDPQYVTVRDRLAKELAGWKARL